MMRYIISALIITFIIPAFGVVMGIVKKTIYRVLAFISPGFAFTLINYFTFLGVVHHELSHALFGFITGAKITKVNLFKPNGISLGNVQMIYRGPWLFRCIQGCLSAIGPVVMGIITTSLIVAYLLPNISSIYAMIFIYYLIFSIIMHMTMSSQDMACFMKGVAGVYILVMIVCVVANINVIP